MFDRTADANLTWYLDDHQCPEAAGPLAQSAYAYIFRGFGNGPRARGVAQPPTLRHLFHRGHLYVHFAPPGGPPSAEGQAEPGAPQSPGSRSGSRRSRRTWPD